MVLDVELFKLNVVTRNRTRKYAARDVRGTKAAGRVARRGCGRVVLDGEPMVPGCGASWPGHGASCCLFLCVSVEMLIIL